jgi:hypothetical protein
MLKYISFILLTLHGVKWWKIDLENLCVLTFYICIDKFWALFFSFDVLGLHIGVGGWGGIWNFFFLGSF